MLSNSVDQICKALPVWGGDDAHMHTCHACQVHEPAGGALLDAGSGAVIHGGQHAYIGAAHICTDNDACDIV